MILINPHQHRHINTAHPTDIRVNVFGTSGFNVKQIIPSTVTLGGAHPIFAFTRHINRDQFLDETFVFRGTDVNLPPGITQATVTGSLTTGQTFSSSTQVFNRNLSFYQTAKVENEIEKRDTRPNKVEFPAATLAHKLQKVPGATVIPIPATVTSVPVTAFPLTSAALNPNDLAGPIISIKRREPVVEGQQFGPKVPLRVHASMNRYLRTAEAQHAAQAVRGQQCACRRRGLSPADLDSSSGCLGWTTSVHRGVGRTIYALGWSPGRLAIE